MDNMPVTDPAWFYSTLAQSSAAIVSLMGAVLVSRVLERSSQIKEDRKKLLENVRATALRHETKIIRNGNYKRFIESNLDRLENAIKERHGIIFSNGMDWRTNYSESIVPAENLEIKKTEFRKDLDQINIAFQIFESLSSYIEDKKILKYIKKLEDSTLLPEVEENLRQDLLSEADSIKKCLSEINKFKKNLLPNSLWYILGSLVWISLTGVLWPISAFPGLSEPLLQKRFLLGAFSIGLISLVSYFIYQFIPLTKLGRFSWDDQE